MGIRDLFRGRVKEETDISKPSESPAAGITTPNHNRARIEYIKEAVDLGILRDTPAVQEKIRELGASGIPDELFEMQDHLNQIASQQLDARIAGLPYKKRRRRSMPRVTKIAIPGGGEIRKFADANIQASIEKALGELKDGEQGAVVAYADKDLVKLAVVGKIGDHWSFVGNLSHTWDGTIEGDAAVRFAW